MDPMEQQETTTAAVATTASSAVLLHLPTAASAPSSAIGRRGGVSIASVESRARTAGFRGRGLFDDDDPPDRVTMEFNALFKNGASEFSASTKEWHEKVVGVLNRPPTAERSAHRRLGPVKGAAGAKKQASVHRFSDVVKVAKAKHKEDEYESLQEVHYPPVKESITIGDLNKFDHPNSKSNLCFKCWGLVPAEPQSLSCQYCPIVAHVECAQIIHRDAKEALGIAASAINKTRVALEVSRHRGEGAPDVSNPDVTAAPNDSTPAVAGAQRDKSSANDADTTIRAKEFLAFPEAPASRRGSGGLTVITTATDVGVRGGGARPGQKWACPFCVEDVHRHNDFYRNKHEDNFFDPDTELKMITTVQSVVRMILARRRWAKRLMCAVKIQRFYRSRGVQLQTRDELKMQKRSVAFAIHEVQLCLDIGKNDTDASRTRQETLRLGDFGCLMLDRYFHHPPSDQPGLLPMIELLQENMHNPPVIIEPIEKIYSPGTLFMSVTLHDNMDMGKQVYRLDMPLGALSDKTMEKLAKKSPLRLNLNNIPATARREGILVGAPGLEIESMLVGAKSDRRVWVTLRPVVRGVSLFPACSADFTVRFTVSEVVKWPNSLTLGRSEYNLVETLIAKDVVMFAQTLEKPMRGDDPIVMARHCRLSVNDHQAGVQKKKITYIPGLGKLLWSVVPLSSASCITGPLFFLKSATVNLKASNAKQNWCCIVQKVLRVFSEPLEIVPKETIELSKCQATLMGEVRIMRYFIIKRYLGLIKSVICIYYVCVQVVFLEQLGGASGTQVVASWYLHCAVSNQRQLWWL